MSQVFSGAPSASQISAIGHLLLARLLVPAKRPPTRGNLKKDLDPLWQHRHSAAECAALLDQTLADLSAAGLLTPKPLALTDAGQRTALDFLGLAAVPPKLTWSTLKNNFLLVRALHLSAVDAEARKRLATVDGLRAVVLKQCYQLATTEVPNVMEALDALAWKQLDVADGGKFTRDAVLVHRFGLDGKPTAAQVKARLATQAVARNSRPDELRLAVLRQWLEASAPATPAVSPMPTPAPESDHVPLTLLIFAERVLEMARATPTGRFGEHKVFINHAWRTLQAGRMFPDLTEADFKQRLAEANQAGLLVLSRADLVEAMSPDDVRDSEVRYLNATFHFIQI